MYIHVAQEHQTKAARDIAAIFGLEEESPRWTSPPTVEEARTMLRSVSLPSFLLLFFFSFLS